MSFLEMNKKSKAIKSNNISSARIPDCDSKQIVRYYSTVYPEVIEKTHAGKIKIRCNSILVMKY